MAAGKKRPLLAARNGIQIALGLFLLYIGYRFYLFISFIESGGTGNYVSRPPAVEAFLPINALMSFRYWLATGEFDLIHPAALAIFLAIILVSLLFKKGFCSWLCPIGTISEGLDRLGQKLFGERFYPPVWLNRILMSLKYLLLGFFVYAIFFSMSIMAIRAFMMSPYALIADVKMLQFFLSPSNTTIAVLLGLAVLSLVIPHFWCRYLCPYGALLGVVSFISPWKITRNRDYCTDCGRCNKVCPSNLKVSQVNRVYSPECTGCLNCIEECPQQEALGIAFPRGTMNLNPWLAGAMVVIVFFLVVGTAQLTGYWETMITIEDYRQLIPQADFFSHP